MIEQKFRRFRNTLTEEQFEDPIYLEQQARIIAIGDPILANRILDKAKNLQQQKVNKINAAIRRNDRAVLNQECSESKSDEIMPDTKGGVIESEVKNEETKSNSNNEVSKQRENYLKLFSIRKLAPTLIVLSIILFSVYQIFLASPRYESRAQLIIQQPDSVATMDTSMALLAGLGGTISTSDNELLKAYILSNDMLDFLDNKLKLKKHYSDYKIDLVSRLKAKASLEEFSEFYKKHLKVEINEKSGVLTISAQGFSSTFSHQLVSHILERAEWYINSIGHKLAESQLDFIRNEHSLVERQLQNAQLELLEFQKKYNLLDPTAEGIAMQQITYGLEGEISKKEAELKALLSVMTPSSYQVKNLKYELEALYNQVKSEREKLSLKNDTKTPVSELLAQFTDYKVKLDLALQAYTSSQISLEKARIEAYKQLKYLVVVESATSPEESTYPRTIYNILLFSVVLVGFSLIIKIVVSVIRELR